MCHSKPGTPRQVKLNMSFDPASKAGFFRLRAPLDLAGEMTMLYLYIHPDQITSLVYTGFEGTPGTVPCLRFALNKPADLIVPMGVSLSLKRPKVDGIILNSLKLLAQETTLCVYMAHGELSKTLLESLCAAVADQSLKPSNMTVHLSGLYKGRGAKVLQGAAQSSTSNKRPRASSSGSSGNEPQDIKADCWKKPATLPAALSDQSTYEEFLLFQAEFQQMRTRLRELEEESRQTRAEMEMVKKATITMNLKQMRAETANEAQEMSDKPTLSQEMRNWLDIYSKVEVEDLVHDGTLNVIAKEELCNQDDINFHFERFEDDFGGYTRSEVDTMLEEVKRAQDTADLVKELGGYFCDEDDVEEIVNREMRNVYTVEEVDDRLYEVRQSCEGINRIETEDLILDSRDYLEKEVMNELRDAKMELRRWSQNLARSEITGIKKMVRKVVRSRIQRRRLSDMPPWRKFSHEHFRTIILPTLPITAAATTTTTTTSSSLAPRALRFATTATAGAARAQRHRTYSHASTSSTASL
ncbi:hypothetical protein VM1G_11248 [Cytospora mali]|uniref:Uncharacterized protein n=1 Tax=Cytospora mali TaxID=578113 RepID=A0A194VJY1_CYTMA|nr:hypothetical protein VM1G_11248 [Valsa mali]